MEPFFATVFSGTVWGAFMGAGLGTFSGIWSMHKRPAPSTLRFKHPTTNQVVELDTFGLDDGAGVVPLMRRVHQAMSAEPSIRAAARQQFMVVLARLRYFYNTLQISMAQPDVLKYKIKTRKCATVAAQSITNFEGYVWDSPEIGEIMGCLAVVQKAVIDKMLFLDK